MPTDDTQRTRFGQLADQALLSLLTSEESDGLTSAEFRALTEGPIVLLTAFTEHEKAASIPVIVLFFGALCYAFLRDARRGQSLGKRAARLMVVSLTTGRPCSARDSAFRSLVLLLTGVLIPGVGWLIEPIVVLVDKDGRRLGDRAADTQVIELSSYNAA